MDTLVPSTPVPLVYAIYKSYVLRLTLLLITISVIFGSLAFKNDATSSFLFVGGVLGAISSVLVILDILVKKRESAMRLLFWRAFSDLGVAIRFMLTYSFNQRVCHHDICSVADSESNCGFPSALLEFFEIASEMWFIIVAIDLWKSLVNPFSSTNSWMWKYHIAVWTISLAFALPTGLDPNIYGFWYVDSQVDSTAICWITQKKHSKELYVYFLFYIPLILVYIVAIISVFVAYRRLRHGISSTIIHRMKALVINSINVLVYMAYWGLLLFLLSLAFLLDNFSSEKWAERVLLFLISAKGVSAVVVWILTVDVQFEPQRDGLQLKEEGGVDLNGALRQELLYFATTGIRTCAAKSATVKKDQKQLVLYLQHREEKSGVELSPLFFLNLIFGREQEKRKIVALSSAAHEITRLTPLEIEVRDNSIISNNDENRKSQLDGLGYDIRMSQRPTEVAGKSGISFASEAVEMGILGNSVDKDPSDRAVGRQTEIVVTKVEESVKREFGFSWLRGLIDRTFGDGRNDVAFVEVEPYHFLRVRKSQRVTDEDYIEQFRTTIKERVTQGGASGAFFFFSRDEKFIAKSCTEEEFQVLTSNAKPYADYFESQKGKKSYISKVYGAYMMQIYGINLYFFVMNNLFYEKDELGNNLSIHEKYDIKGSTVNRSSVPPVEGQIATCTHCEQKFVYNRKLRKTTLASKSVRGTPDEGNLDTYSQRERCNVTVSGQHEPTVILKDNDLKYKIRLPRSVAKQLVAQLENDAHFLHDIGVMDYSLLVGVHNTQYEVRGDRIALASGNSQSKSGDIPINPLHSINLSGNLGVFDGVVDDDDFHTSRRLEVSRVVGPDTYIMGIIDFQQKWNFSKKLERFFKVQIKGEDSYGLSAIAPNIYRDRFIAHIRGILDVDDLDSTM